MITVFTPTYNRAYILGNLYASLCCQTNKNFEWIIVDDGSQDDTPALVDLWQKANNFFEIKYQRVQNGGKHRAVNLGVKMAHGELFFIVDSDDRLTEDAIDKIEQWRAGLGTDKKYAGVSGLRGKSKERHIGGKYGKSEYIDAKNTERKKFNLLGDKAEAYFTDVLKRYPFPEFEGETFITEEVVWNAIAIDGYYIRWFNEVIYICDYLDDGLTKNRNNLLERNPCGVRYWAKLQLRVFPHNLKKKLYAIYMFYKVSKHMKSKSEIAKDLGVTRLTLHLTILLFVILKIDR